MSKGNLIFTGFLMVACIAGIAYTQSFSDNFDDGNDNGWTKYGKPWYVESGKYVCTGSGLNRSVVSLSSFGNASMALDMQIGTSAKAGLLFRVTNPSVGSYFTGYYASVRTSLIYPTKDTVRLAWYDAQGEHIMKSVVMDVIPATQWYRLRVEAVDFNISVYFDKINGPGQGDLPTAEPRKLLIEYSSGIYLSGRIGVCCTGYFGGSAYAYVDNVWAKIAKNVLTLGDSNTEGVWCGVGNASRIGDKMACSWRYYFKNQMDKDGPWAVHYVGTKSDSYFWGDPQFAPSTGHHWDFSNPNGPRPPFFIDPSYKHSGRHGATLLELGQGPDPERPCDDPEKPAVNCVLYNLLSAGQLPSVIIAMGGSNDYTASGKMAGMESILQTIKDFYVSNGLSTSYEVIVGNCPPQKRSSSDNSNVESQTYRTAIAAKYTTWPSQFRVFRVADVYGQLGLEIQSSNQSGGCNNRYIWHYDQADGRGLDVISYLHFNGHGYKVMAQALVQAVGDASGNFQMYRSSTQTSYTWNAPPAGCNQIVPDKYTY